MEVPSGEYVAAPYGQVSEYGGSMDAEIYRLQTMGHRSGLHKFFLMVNIMAGLTGVNNIVAQCVALRYPGNLPMEVVLRIYLIGFCALVILNEMERTPMVKESLVLSNWVCRGVFYTFLGVLGHNLYDVGHDNRYRRNNGYNGYSNNNSNNNYRNGDYYGYYGPRMPSSEDFAEWYIWMTSALMFMVGCLYIIMGVLCLQKKLQQLRSHYQQSPAA